MVPFRHEGALTIWSAKPNRLRSLVEDDAFGRIERGTDGLVVWEKSTMAGAVVKSGQEKADMLRDATFDRRANVGRDTPAWLRYSSSKLSGYIVVAVPCQTGASTTRL